MKNKLDELISRIEKGNFPNDFEHFGGASLIITNDPERKGHSGDTIVLSEHASALSWLTVELANLFQQELNYMSKYAFYPTLGQCMNEQLTKQEDLIDCLLKVVKCTENGIFNK